MAQKNLQTVDIKGKPYVLVNERVKAFRENYPGYSLVTSVVELTDKRVVMCAAINNPEGTTVATGYAYEESGSSFINKTSYIENCETSAWGRALANFGIGIDSSMCSADELSNALLNQENTRKSEPISTPEQELNDMLDSHDDKPKPKTLDEAAINTLRGKLKEYNSACGKKATEADFAGLCKRESFAELDYRGFKHLLSEMDKHIEKAKAKIYEADRQNS